MHGLWLHHTWLLLMHHTWLLLLHHFWLLHHHSWLHHCLLLNHAWLLHHLWLHHIHVCMVPFFNYYFFNDFFNFNPKLILQHFNSLFFCKLFCLFCPFFYKLLFEIVKTDNKIYICNTSSTQTYNNNNSNYCNANTTTLIGIGISISISSRFSFWVSNGLAFFVV